MKCERCLSPSGEEATATYRAYTKVMNMKVCGTCAEEARRLGIAVEILAQTTSERTAEETEAHRESSALSSGLK